MENTEKVTTTKHKRKPLLAAISTFLYPGLGQVYTGNIVRGMGIAFACGWLTISAYLALCYSSVKTAYFLIFLSSILLIRLIPALDAWKIARKKPKNYQLKEYNRWYFYIFVLFILGYYHHAGIYAFTSKYVMHMKCSGNSMLPTLFSGDRTYLNKMAYQDHKPKRGDIVCFADPYGGPIDFFKRIIAIPGDTLEIKENIVYLNDEELTNIPLGRFDVENFAFDQNSDVPENIEGTILLEKNINAEYKVFWSDNTSSDQITGVAKHTMGEDEYYVLGDNRKNSGDSRIFFTIQSSAIKGRTDYLLWPNNKDWSRFGSLKPR